ncbi:hypothetical protein FEM48_Zijuj01G0148700 [Ziziphus jujuba var. spinosa]|uniref:(E,E)-geranyllinalool synthase-like n=1 Tax=Ziziphus jujuba var. spinosa TaxID=714518 RepID=A0A978W1W8_ZIZJJ|nr:hypothetical protein FEM48_Zijuj01G0148700 [Ziziphus jujuba var. spinosa]
MQSAAISSVETQVKTIKEMMFSENIDPYQFVSPSAYDTAWLAIIPDSHHQNMKPMFQNCLNWVLNNQKQQGFWGECDSHGMPSIECLIATLACIIALKKWDVGSEMIDKGMDFVHSNSEKFLSEIKDNCPRTLAIVLPAMFELSKKVGLKIELEEIAIADIFCQRQRILDTEQAVDDYNYPPLLSFLEALPSEYEIDEEDITKNLSGDGSLFHSPSATSFAFMATGNKHCLIPTMYPMDEELIKLCVINHLHRLGLAEYFVTETERVLEQVYKNYKNHESWAKPSNLVSAQLLKDSLAFRLLRMHGYNVLPWSMRWSICDEKIKALVQNNLEFFCSVMLNIYRATDLMFSGEYELQESRSFSRNLLEKSILTGAADQNSFRKLIEHELSLPWMARLDHLDHRLWIEANENNALWKGKVFFQRLSSHYNDKLIHLAMQNYEFKQSIYKDELEELRRWSKDLGLTHMGFGREKTTYCYFAAAAACTSLPYDSDVRKMVAKSAIIVTVADDFFDMKGSLSDLNCLTEAVQRWDDKRLSGLSKKIFNALDNIVQEMSMKYYKQHGSDITNNLRDIWYETFDSWMTESNWSRSEYIPSIDEYLQTGMISIAAHTIVLPPSCFLTPSLPESKLRPFQYENITKLLMVIARLLNDMQSYQKEKCEGKINSILLCLQNNPEADMEGTIEYVKEIVEKKKMEFIEQVLMDGFNDLPKACRQFHLSCLKTFQMFFHSSNRFDSNTEMIEDINKAIYKPLSLPSQPTKKCCPTINCHFGGPFLKYNYVRITSVPRQLSGINNASRNGFWNMAISPPKFSFGFI